MAGTKAERKGGGRSLKSRPAPQDAATVFTVDELRRIYDEGIPIRSLSGLVIQVRPVRIDRLLMEGKVPDILTPLVMRMMFGKKPDDVEFPDEISDPVTHYVTRQRAEAADAVAFMQSVDVVCEAALVDASVLPYLDIVDRLWVFKMALLRAEVLSTFRHEPQRDVEAVSDQQADAQPTQPDHVSG